MPKLTATVLVVVLAIMALLWLYTQPDPVPEFPEPDRGGASAQPNVAETGLATPVASRRQAVHAAPAADPGAPTIDSAQTDPSAEVDALGAQNTNETAIPITPGFETLLEPSARTRSRAPSVTIEQHERLLAEGRDEEWAGRIESAIRSFFESSLTAQGLDAHRIELPVIECRTTLCEAQAIGAAADANSTLNAQSLATQMVHGPLASDFSDSASDTFGLPDGRIGYLVFLTRNGTP